MRDLDRYRSTVHPLLSVLLPAAFLVPFGSLIADAIRTFFAPTIPNFPYGPLGFSVVTMTTGFTASLMGNLLRDERASATARLRELAVLLLFWYCAASLLVPGPFTERLKPHPANVVCVLLCAVQWLFTVKFQEGLRDRELFIAEMEGARGLALQNKVRDSAGLAEDALAGLNLLRLSGAVFAGVLGLSWLLCVGLGASIRTTTALSAIPCFILLPIAKAIVSQYDYEHYAAGEGLAVESSLRARRLRTALALIAVSFAAALPLSGEESLLSPRLLASFLDWLAGLIRFDSGRLPPPPLPPRVPTSRNDIWKELAEARKFMPLIDLTAFFAVLRKVAIVASVAASALFLLSPLFSRDFREALRKRSLGRFIRGKLRSLAFFLRLVREEPREAVLLGDADLREVRERLLKIASGRKGAGKRREIGRMTKSFLKLVEWGSARSFVYAPSAAPGEYLASVASAFPSLAEDLRTVGALFEEALYSDHTLGPLALRSYESAVRRITDDDRRV